ncbi:tetratricopeptide repeat protein [Bacillus licheniformis]|nr:tetratricopeptide repeat protein [Bacillus licheniformis]
MTYGPALKAWPMRLKTPGNQNSHLTAAAHFNLGNCYFHQESYREASDHMESALSILNRKVHHIFPKCCTT